MNPRRKENLKPFPKGKSGNPNGRPKTLPSLTKLMAECLGTNDENERNSKAQKIIEALIKQAEKGNTRAAEILLDRGYGKPDQKINQVTEMTINVKRK